MEWISKHTSELADWPDSEPGWVIGPSFDNDFEKEWQIDNGGYQSDPSEEKEFLLNYVAFVRDASGPFTNYNNKTTKYETDDGRYLYGPEAAKLISGAPEISKHIFPGNPQLLACARARGVARAAWADPGDAGDHE